MLIKSEFFRKVKLSLSCLLLVAFMVCAELSGVIFGAQRVYAETNALSLESKSAILMEASTGQVIYEKEADVKVPPASITKIMTLILIFEACENGKISLEDEVTVSEHAASMGGSQVFLEEGEKQTVETMIKCISIASANDACVAMAEYVAGSEENFVSKMNEKAATLGMNNTHFVNCCGLDADGHESSARDVAIMSRELINKYPKIHEYSAIWMDTIIHSTRKGEKEFVLTNTNKLMKQYEWATGLKTGSTSGAGCCLSATAQKDGINLIAVVLSAPNSKTRFAEAIELLNYGYSICDIYVDEDMPKLESREIKGAQQDSVELEYEKSFSYMFIDGYDESKISKELKFYDDIKLPLQKGAAIGELCYYYDNTQIGSVSVCVKEDVNAIDFVKMLQRVIDVFLL